MILSVREVHRLSQRCFWAAGCSEANAKANAKSIWWTESYKGSGFTTLHTLLDELEELDPRAMSMRDRDSMTSLIDSKSQPVVVSSTPALDLSCAQANEHGIGVTHATTKEDDDSLPTLGHVASHAAERGYVSAVLYADGSGNAMTVLGTPMQPLPLIAETELESPPVSYERLLDVIDTGVHGRRQTPLTQAMFVNPAEDERHSTADARLLDRLIRQATEPTGDGRVDQPGLFVVCIDPSHPAQSGEVGNVVEGFVRDREAAFTEVFDPDTITDRIDTLLHNGVEVEREVWRDIFEFSNGILAPPFEGSEEGAGFGLNELDK
jgi:LDH2 family malate/lactate/ureidoglycolate dehydrogenase